MAPITHEFIEFGAVPGQPQPIQEGAKFGGFFLEALQGFLAVFIKGAVAGWAQTGWAAPTLLPALHPLLEAIALALPPFSRSLLPARQIRMPSTSHASAP